MNNTPWIPTAVFSRCTCGAVFVTYDVESNIDTFYEHVWETTNPEKHLREDIQCAYGEGYSLTMKHSYDFA